MHTQPKIEGVSPLPYGSLNGCRFAFNGFHFMGDVIGQFVSDGAMAVVRYRTHLNMWLVYKVQLNHEGEWVGEFHSQVPAET